MTTLEPARARTTNPVVARFGAALGAGVAAVGSWALLTGPVGLDLMGRSGDQVFEVGPAAVAFAATGFGLAGWLVARIIESRAAAPRRRWLQVAVVVAVLSLGGPLVSAIDAEAIIGLELLHVVTALVVIPTVAVTLPAKRASVTT